MRDGEAGMDRCASGDRRHAVTWWASDTDEEGWALCQPCTDRHGDALRHLGYELWMDAREVEVVS